MPKQILLSALVAAAAIAGAPAANAAAAQSVAVKVTVAGFEPSTISVHPGSPVILHVTRTTDATCATEIVFPDLKITKQLPLNQDVEIALGALKKGTIRFGCGMSLMLGGVISAQ